MEDGSMKSIKKSCSSCKCWGPKFHKEIHEAYGPIHPYAKVCTLGFTHTEKAVKEFPSQMDYRENLEFYSSDEYIMTTTFGHKSHVVVTLSTDYCEGYKPK